MSANGSMVRLFFIDLRADKKSRRKRSTSGTCNGRYRSNIVAMCWSGCTKTCYYTDYGYYDRDSKDYYPGNVDSSNYNYVPSYCGGSPYYTPCCGSYCR